MFDPVMMQLTVGREKSASPEVGLLSGTNLTMMFWAWTSTMVGSGALKVTEFQASVPQGKRSKSKKGKRPGEVLLWINLCLGTENGLVHLAGD